MPYGYNGKIARVDLSRRQIKMEQPDKIFYRKYMGGRNFAGFFLLRELGPGTDPLGPENKLIFTTSVLTGVPFPGNSRFTVAAKSPLTNAYGESQAGGFWAAEFKFSGYDAVIVEGKADEPVYLWIHHDTIEIKDANHCWGRTTGDTQQLIREELGDSKIRIACIGPAGEKLVKFACIVNDLKHVNGRNGMGAVMGSKNLKAIAVRGHKRVKVKNPNALRNLSKLFNQSYLKNPENALLQNLGTPGYVKGLNAAGLLPTYNFRQGTHEKAENLSGEKMSTSILVGKEGCYACPVKCKKIVRTEGKYWVDPIYGAPEYETIAALGSNCGIFDIEVVAKGNELCNKFGMDTISTGGVIAFTMECFEKGILTQSETGGIELKFGNEEAMLALIEIIAFRKNIGNLLAEGSMRAAKKLGRGAERFAMHVKGQEIPLHEPRGKFGVGLMYAVSPIGADHLQAEHDPVFSEEGFALDQVKPLGILEPLNTLDLGPKKIRLLRYLHLVASLHDVLDLCIFVGFPTKVYTLNHYVELVRSITGWETSLWELMKVGERAINLIRCFNVREGFTKEDDTLPKRFFEELKGGPFEGQKIPKEDFERARGTFYSMMGWDTKTGIPQRAKLEELDIGWVSDILEKTPV